MEGSGSVFDQFRAAEQRVAERLRELEPLVEEYHKLEQVAQRLGLDRSEHAPAPDKQRPASPARTQGRRRRSKTKARTAQATREDGAKSATAKASAAGAPTRAARRAGTVSDQGRPALNRGSRQQDIVRLVNEHPGITVREIAGELGVDATGLYRPVHKLEQQGAISKQGAALQPTGR
jgi:CRP-like cAMP-binding protein